MNVHLIKIDLKALKSKDTIRRHDILQSLRIASTLSKYFADYKGFSKCSLLVKEMIAVFEIIFSKAKANSNLKKCINKSCNAITVTYFVYLKSFHQFEPNYKQQLYARWREILLFMKASARANSFYNNLPQFELLLSHLQVARHRFEQMVILDILSLYTEMSLDISHLTNMSNNDIENLDLIINLGKRRSDRQKHALINLISSYDDHILIIKPKRVASVNFLMNGFSAYKTNEYEMWLDFNIKDNSMVFNIICLTDEKSVCEGIVVNPIVHQNIFHGDVHLIVTGSWNLLYDNEHIATVPSNCKILFVLPINVQNLILKARNVFNITPYQRNNILQDESHCRSDSTIMLLPSIKPNVTSDDTESSVFTSAYETGEPCAELTSIRLEPSVPNAFDNSIKFDENMSLPNCNRMEVDDSSLGELICVFNTMIKSIHTFGKAFAEYVSTSNDFNERSQKKPSPRGWSRSP